MPLTLNIPPSFGTFFSSSWNTPQPLGADAQPMSLVAIVPPFTQTWGIFHLNGARVFDVDSCISLDFANNAKVSGFPVEQGGFANYNKVGTPFEPKVSLAVGGQQRIKSFMNDLMDELATVTLYNIITPEMTYFNVTLEKYEYKRSQKAGKNLLHANLSFKQIVEVAPQYSSVKIVKPKKPSAKDKEGHGKTQTVPAPNIYQQNNILARQRGLPDPYPGQGVGSQQPAVPSGGH
jgi:hypothetical protein